MLQGRDCNGNPQSLVLAGRSGSCGPTHEPDQLNQLLAGVVDHVDESRLNSRACFSEAGMPTGSMHVAESFLTLFTTVLTG